MKKVKQFTKLKISLLIVLFGALMAHAQKPIFNELTLEPQGAPSNPPKGKIYVSNIDDGIYYYNGVQWISMVSTSSTVTGNEPAFDGWDKDSSDDFDGVFSSLTGIPADIADGDDFEANTNDFTTSASLTGETVNFTVPNQSGYSLDLSAFAQDVDFSNYVDLNTQQSILGPKTYTATTTFENNIVFTDGTVTSQLTIFGGVPILSDTNSSSSYHFTRDSGTRGVFSVLRNREIDTYNELNAIVADANLAVSGGNVSDFTNDAGYITGQTDDQTADEVPVADSGDNYTATDVEGILAEIAPQLGGGGSLTSVQEDQLEGLYGSWYDLMTGNEDGTQNPYSDLNGERRQRVGYVQASQALEVQLDNSHALGRKYMYFVSSDASSLNFKASSGVDVIFEGAGDGQSADQVLVDSKGSHVYFTRIANNQYVLSASGSITSQDSTPPTIISATVENNDPDLIVVLFDEPVNVVDVTGLSLDGDLSGLSVSSIAYSLEDMIGLNLSGNVANGDSGNLVYNGSNTITDDAGNSLAGGSTSVTNNVSGGNAYTSANAANTNETTGSDAGFTATNNVTLNGTDSTLFTNGTESVEVTVNTPSSFQIRFDGAGITNGQTILLEYDIYVEGAGSGNIFIRLNDAQGWDVQQQYNLGDGERNQWVSISQTATATQDTPEIQVQASSSVTGVTAVYFDNVRFTVQ